MRHINNLRNASNTSNTSNVASDSILHQQLRVHVRHVSKLSRGARLYTIDCVNTLAYKCTCECVRECIDMCYTTHPHNTLEYCNAVQHAVTRYNTMQRTATHTKSRLAAPHCATLQHAAARCNTLQHTATRSNTQQHAATHCTTLQHTATHCNTLQHT